MCWVGKGLRKIWGHDSSIATDVLSVLGPWAPVKVTDDSEAVAICIGPIDLCNPSKRDCSLCWQQSPPLNVSPGLLAVQNVEPREGERQGQLLRNGQHKQFVGWKGQGLRETWGFQTNTASFLICRDPQKLQISVSSCALHWACKAP